MCSLLKLSSEECQQNYYKYLNKLESVDGIPPKVLSHPRTPKHDSMGSLKDDNDSTEANAYVVAAVAMENKKKKD